MKADDGNFQRSLLLTMYLPQMITKRLVVFSTDQLIVAFGGAASFFLGCNFLSVIELLYFVLHFCWEKCKKVAMAASAAVDLQQKNI
uniref:Uncharacterized protein n=1 Tax=Megaselia scalaris TaxID=36166 RepID=T1GJG0_MEGSC